MCRRLAQEHPDRATHRWIARRNAEGGWSVVKVRLPEEMRRDPLEPTTEAKPRPQQAEDPRTAIARNLPGTYHV